ncbi:MULTISPECIES: dihydrodipicolinate synthase family protein [Latilactobacillus]|uniref:dihydrodipicolinate synthase family protein n=1 Tax=Latilactobacillus TaxID=2767885 RepID=UPI000DAAE74B|nr:dihydrodipicolinate synthase family protein [Latilactobacillus curvatus]AWV73834.1 hypothetical protein C0W45_09895 [Latilactobacillus curvatus]MCP8860371.1 dihydrodipicolinate synthase family protein [Latilactobacillus curvatus]MDG2985848.1 dihydrodipicolinate synthase family protein [Latilactobacillus curvatus]QWF36610.1 dihydrodipicolinate synthase family protein [Latilactobacillus curvatus]
MGSIIIIGGTYGVYPELLMEADRCVREDDLEKALQIQLKINDLISELTSFKGNLYDVMKLILAKRGVSVGRARNPLPHVEDDEMDHVEVVRQHIDDAIAEFTK